MCSSWCAAKNFCWDANSHNWICILLYSLKNWFGSYSSSWHVTNNLPQKFMGTAMSSTAWHAWQGIHELGCVQHRHAQQGQVHHGVYCVGAHGFNMPRISMYKHDLCFMSIQEKNMSLNHFMQIKRWRLIENLKDPPDLFLKETHQLILLNTPVSSHETHHVMN
jgi:hypothetical protein